MNFKDCVALVTGANRGLGKAYARALLDAGAAKVYAAARQPEETNDPRLVPIRLDVTRDDDVAAAAQQCADISLLINNAGTMQVSPVLGDGAIAALQRDIEVNVYGPLRMARAFAPVLAANGGGTLVNMLSVTAWFVSPLNPTYCISKWTAAGATEALRAELRGAGTRVVGVYAGLIDTDMVAAVRRPKVSASAVAARVLQGIAAGEDYLLADSRAEELWQVMKGGPALIAQATRA